MPGMGKCSIHDSRGIGRRRNGYVLLSNTLTSVQTYNETNVSADRTYDANSTSLAEIADVLGISIGTVESRLFRARARFRERLLKDYPEFSPGGGD